MPNENRVSIKFTAEKLEEIRNAIKVIEDDVLPQMIALSAAERRALPKLKDKSIAFVQKTIDYTDTESRFVPSYMDPVETKVDFAAYTLLIELFNRLQRITGPVQDTALLCGSETMSSVLQYYNNVKLCAKENVPGAKEVYEDLKVRFEKSKSTESDKTETTT